MGAASQQRTLNPPDTWSCLVWELNFSIVLRPFFSELVMSTDFRTSLATSILLVMFPNFEFRISLGTFILLATESRQYLMTSLLGQLRRYKWKSCIFIWKSQTRILFWTKNVHCRKIRNSNQLRAHRKKTKIRTTRHIFKIRRNSSIQRNNAG